MDCGPSNAVQNLAKHSQRDTSLQNQFRGQPQQQGRSFRQGPQVDARLNLEFAEFSGVPSAMHQPQFQQMPMAQGPMAHGPRAQAPIAQTGNQGWVQDFGNLKLLSQSQQGQAQWASQFQNLGMHQAQSQPQQMAQHPMQAGQMRFQPMMGVLSMGQMTRPQFLQQLEHQQVHKEEQNQQQFDDKFAEIERELAGEQQHVADDRDLEKDEFAKIAAQISLNVGAQVADSTDSLMQEKFAALGFMGLMQQVADKQVELEGDKLVDLATREEVKAGETTSEAPARVQLPLEPNYHQPMADDWAIPNPVRGQMRPMQLPETEAAPPQPQEARPDQENKLPDPLAHIADGALGDITDPLMMAQVISGGQVLRKAWMDADDDWMDATGPFQPRPYRGPLSGGPPSGGPRSIMNPHEQEVFDDYRHDDDYH